MVVGVALVSFLLLLRETTSSDEPQRAEQVSRDLAVYSEPLALSDESLLPSATGDELVSGETGGVVLDERFIAGEEAGVVVHELLLDLPGLPYLVRSERQFVRDPISGEEKLLGILDMVADRLVVRLRENADIGLVGRELGTLDIRLGRRLMGESVYELLLPSAALESVPDGLANLLASSLADECLYLEPDYVVHTLLEPNDPSYLDGSLWGLNNTGQSDGVADVDIGAAEGWELRSDAGEIVVAVIDTGINYLHRDLAPNMWENDLEISGNGIDDDGNGWVDDIHGINAVSLSGDPMDDNGHGTHCSGTIAGAGDDGVGIVGVAWNAQLMGLKFLSANGSGATSDAIVCIDYALQMGADILSNSWGGGGYSQALYDAISVAEENGVLFVAAAGNAATNTDEAPSYPSGYELENVVSVASVDRQGELSVFSNYGLESVDLAAPGSEILSTWIGGGNAYKTISGTSMAAPHVSGILALLLTEYPDSGFDEQIGRLVYGGVKLESLDEKVAFGVMANLAGALALVKAPSPPTWIERPVAEAYLAAGEDWELKVTVGSETAVSYQWYFGDIELVGETGDRLIVQGLSPDDSGVYAVVVSNEDGSIRARSGLEVLNADSRLSEAGEASFWDFHSYGDTEWSVYAFDSVAGATSIRSGEIEDDEESAVFVNAMGPGRISFSWRISAEPFWDYGEFLLDGERQELLRNGGDWSSYSVLLPQARAYRLEWKYLKDGTGTSGQDALFLDGFQFSPLEQSPPVILRQPEGALLGTGANYRLSVEAVGAGPEYQWFKDGLALPGSNAADFNLVASSQSVDGDYTVVVSNAYGSIRSVAARIEVLDRPAKIESPLEDLTLSIGESGYLEVEVSGSIPYTIRWYHDDRLIPGAESARLAFTAAQVSDAGSYRVEVGNAFNSNPVSSNVATVEVVEFSLAPRFVKQPQSGYWQTGDSLTLSAAVEGTFPFTFQWYKDGQLIPGETNRSLDRLAASLADEGSYRLEASNAFGVAKSSVARVRILGDIDDGLDSLGLGWRVGGDGYFFVQSAESFDGVDALQSQATSAIFGTHSFVEAAVEGPANFSLQWKQESASASSRVGLFVDGELVALLAGDRDWHEAKAWIPEGAHTIRIEATIELGSTVWLDQVDLTPEPVVYHDSDSIVFENGESLEFWVEARGVGLLSYQWYANEIPIPGATGPSHSIRDAGYENIGMYYVDIENEFGSVRSDPVSAIYLRSLADEVGDGSVELDLEASNSWRGALLKGGQIGLRSGYSPEGDEMVLTGVATGPGNLVFDLGIQSIGCCASVELSIDGELYATYRGYEESDGQVSLSQKALWLEEGDHILEWRLNGGDGGLRRTREAYLETIRLVTAPVFERSPRAVRVVEGGSTSLSVSMVGPGPFTYRWFQDGVALEGETADHLSLENVGQAEVGDYYCEAVNEQGLRSRSEAARVEIVLGFYEAIDLDFGRLVGDGKAWSPIDVETPVGGSALSFDAGVAGQLDTLSFEITTPFDGRRALEFWVRVNGLGTGGLLRVAENSGRQIQPEQSTEWQKVVLPLGQLWLNRVFFSVRKGRLDPGTEPVIQLAGFRLSDAPIIYREAKSGARYWGEGFILFPEMVGKSPFSYRWKSGGEVVKEGTTTSERGVRFVTDRFSVKSVGMFEAEIESDHGATNTKVGELRLLDAGFGQAVGWPGSTLWSEGDQLWQVDEERSFAGSRSLTVSGLQSLEESDLVFRMVGPGELSLNWKMDTPSGNDRMSIFINGIQVSGLFASSDWTLYDIDLGNGVYQVRIRMSNPSPSGTDGGRGWVDQVRFLNVDDKSYAEWAAAVFSGLSDGHPDKALLEDPDADGVLNLAEYAFGFDPLSVDHLPTPTQEGRAVSVAFPLDAEVGEATWDLEVTRDLKTWYPVRSRLETEVVDGELMGTLTHTFPKEEISEGIFVRLAVYYLAGEE